MLAEDFFQKKFEKLFEFRNVFIQRKWIYFYILNRSQITDRKRLLTHICIHVLSRNTDDYVGEVSFLKSNSIFSVVFRRDSEKRNALKEDRLIWNFCFLSVNLSNSGKKFVMLYSYYWYRYRFLPYKNLGKIKKKCQFS